MILSHAPIPFGYSGILRVILLILSHLYLRPIFDLHTNINQGIPIPYDPLQLLFWQTVLHLIITALVDTVGVEPTSRGGFMPAFHNATYPYKNYASTLLSFTALLDEAFCSRYLPLGIPSTNKSWILVSFRFPDFFRVVVSYNYTCLPGLSMPSENSSVKTFST